MTPASATENALHALLRGFNEGILTHCTLRVGSAEDIVLMPAFQTDSDKSNEREVANYIAGKWACVIHKIAQNPRQDFTPHRAPAEISIDRCPNSPSDAQEATHGGDPLYYIQ